MTGSTGWVLLLLAIVLELAGTIMMKMSDGFSRILPSVLMFVCYGASFTMLNYAVRYMPISIAYAIWSGVGITLISIAGYYFFGERLKIASVCWMVLIIVGIIGLKWSDAQ
ncbi:DMT family transporter [Paenibacillus wulumuqiensis]|uniref:DMT family transporter n=1 Tax=Paenibacillus wulumuqiensis TaxID=1567107 RepID=UPI00061996E5|nr:multidrug efflux SMR transporter [Paenibacillus wulumuqiensis]